VPMPSHTEDAHLALLCIERGMRLAYCAEAEIFMRAPATLHEYLLQSDRYSEGESLLAAYWPQSVVKRWYRLRAIDVLGATLAQSARTPGDAIVWAAMYAVKLVPFRRREAAGPAWPVSNSTKHLRT
jgi:cellulose synthase/poly-beta-1,6-N-acetylglucosamine synthase-like glycosyltransferase